MYSITTDAKTGRFLKAKEVLIEKMGEVGAKQWFPFLQPCTLKLTAVITPASTRITFQTQKGTNNTDLPGENRLDPADLFFTFGYALGISKVDTSTVPISYGINNSFFYPDPTAFAGTKSGNTTEAQALSTLYKGLLNINTGSYTLLKDFLTENLMKVALLQDSAHTATTLENSIFYTGGNRIMSGNANYTISIDLATGDKTLIDGNIQAAAGTTQTAIRNYAHLYIDGWKLVNGAQTKLENIQL